MTDKSTQSSHQSIYIRQQDQTKYNMCSCTFIWSLMSYCLTIAHCMQSNWSISISKSTLQFTCLGNLTLQNCMLLCIHILTTGLSLLLFIFHISHAQHASSKKEIEKGGGRKQRLVWAGKMCLAEQSRALIGMTLGWGETGHPHLLWKPATLTCCLNRPLSLVGETGHPHLFFKPATLTCWGNRPLSLVGETGHPHLLWKPATLTCWLNRPLSVVGETAHPH